VPRWLYPRVREGCHHMHGQIISDYVRNQPHRAFSEFNALGAFAWMYHQNLIHWVDTTSLQMPEPFAKQFHSWSGLSPAIKSEIEKILSGEGAEILGGSVEADLAGSTPAPPIQIKVLPNDIWVLEGDQISQWVEQEGRLDHDQNFLPDILPHIRPGNTVVDAGAFIGDHTVAYSKAVGSMGVVYAFEPNHIAFTCLEHNTAGLKNVSRYRHGLSDRKEIVPLSGNNGNYGGTYVGEHMKIAEVPMDTLDHSVPWGADFIKIDVEGYEVKVLRGAQNIIKKYHPRLVIEVNTGALERQGAVPGDIFKWLEDHDYRWDIIQKNACVTDPLYDILAVPAGVVAPQSDRTAHSNTNGEALGGSVVVSSQPQQGSPSPKEAMLSAVAYLQTYAAQSVKHRMMVRQRLAFAGLAHKTPKYKKKK
jgi:FkbM family methyltransferase